MSKPKAKKWIDPQDVQLTDPMHKAFIAAEVAGETEADQGKAAQELVNQLLLRKLGLENASPTEKQRALDDLHKKQRLFDPDDLNLAGARKAINKLSAGEFAGAVRAAEASIEQRDSIYNDRFRKKQTNNAKKPRPQSGVNALAAEIERIMIANPDSTSAEVEKRLEHFADESTAEGFYGRDNKFVLRSGLKDRVSRIKKRLSTQQK
jgi:hypothetical protein